MHVVGGLALPNTTGMRGGFLYLSREESTLVAAEKRTSSNTWFGLLFSTETYDVLCSRCFVYILCHGKMCFLGNIKSVSGWGERFTRSGGKSAYDGYLFLIAIAI